MSTHPITCGKCNVECKFEVAAPYEGLGESVYGASWLCPACNERILDLCPVGPLVPTRDTCLNCGGPYANREDGSPACTACGIRQADAISELGAEEAPLDPVALAQEQFSKGLFRRAVAQLNIALQNDRSLEIVWMLKSNFLSGIGYKASERAMLQRAIECGGPISLLVSLGFSYQTTASHAEAIAAYKRYLEVNPAGPHAGAAMCNQANSLAALGQDQDAERLYEQAMAHQPNGVTHYLNYIRFLIDRKRLSEALPVVDKVLQLDPPTEYAIRVLEDKALIFAEGNDGETALASADAALRLGSESIRSHYLRGRALALLGRLQEAQQELDIVLARDPANHDAQRATKMIQAALAQFPDKNKNWWEFWK